MKLIAEIGNEKSDVEIKREGERIRAKVGERSYELEASEVEPNVYLLKYENQIYQMYIAPNGIVNTGNKQFEVKLYDPKRLRGANDNASVTDGAAEIKTAMPGKVIRVLVEQGAEIKKGDGVIIVEAMKMQNEMKAPKDGLVKEIRVAVSATVNAGDILAVIE